MNNVMRVIDVKQRSLEWFPWRAKGLTATDCSIIMGLSSHKTPYRLWQEKTGRAYPPDLSRNPNVLHGVDFEPEARAVMENVLDDILLPVCIESTINPIYRASLDGITFEAIPTELKCPAAVTCEKLEKVETLDDLKAHLPDHYNEYWPQVQHQILVAGVTYGWLMFYDSWNRTNKVLKVERDEEFLAEYQIKAQLFWDENIVKDKAPEMLLDRDLFAPTGVDADTWKGISRQLLEVEKEVKEIESTLKSKKGMKTALADKLEGLMGTFLLGQSDGVKLTKYVRAGRINNLHAIKELCPTMSEEDIKVVLEKYRGKPSECRRISIYNPDDKSKTNIPGVNDGEDLYANLTEEDMIEAVEYF